MMMMNNRQAMSEALGDLKTQTPGPNHSPYTNLLTFLNITMASEVLKKPCKNHAILAQLQNYKENCNKIEFPTKPTRPAASSLFNLTHFCMVIPVILE